MYDIRDKEHGHLLHFDSDEEEAVAQLVIDLILYIGIQEEHYVWLRDMFVHKAKGGLMLVDEFLHLTEIITFYEDLGVEFKFEIPALPFRKSPYTPKRRKTKDDAFDPLLKERKRMQDIAFRARIWKSIWEKNPKLHQWAVFNPFPGDYVFENNERVRQSAWNQEEELQQEERFQKEVAKIMREYEIDRHQATLVVADYIPRGMDHDGIPLVEKLFTQEERDKDLPLAIRLDRMLHSEEE